MGWGGIDAFADPAHAMEEEEEEPPRPSDPAPPGAPDAADGSLGGSTTPDGGVAPSTPRVAVRDPVDAPAHVQPPPPGDDHIPRAARRPGFPQALHPYGNGYLRISQTRGVTHWDMRAVCFRHETCSLSRACKENSALGRPGQPIGLLWSFLTEAHLYDSKDQHRQAVSWQAFEQRRHARADFHILRLRSMRRKRTTSFPSNSSRSHSCQSEQSAARRVRSFFFGSRVTVV